MKKVLSCFVISALFSFSSLVMASKDKCELQLKRDDGTVVHAKLSKSDCKNVKSYNLKKGDKFELTCDKHL